MSDWTINKATKGAPASAVASAFGGVLTATRNDAGLWHMHFDSADGRFILDSYVHHLERFGVDADDADVLDAETEADLHAALCKCASHNGVTAVRSALRGLDREWFRANVGNDHGPGYWVGPDPF